MNEISARAALVPNANNPQLLLRMIQLVSNGIRHPRPLADILEVDLRTVHYYTQAGEWLDLLYTEGEVHLTPRGLALSYASTNDKMRLYSDAVWHQPFAKALLTGNDNKTPTPLPSTSTIATFIRSQQPDLSATTARRRASAVRGLIRPAVGYVPAKPRVNPNQLSLPFGDPESDIKTTPHRLDHRAGVGDNPYTYAYILEHLLNQGELTMGNLRAILDHAGGQDCPIGPYTNMALRRGDARREGDRLIVTKGAVQRRELATDGGLIALTDPDYRAHLNQHLNDVQSPESPRTASNRKRFALWDQRIFGAPLEKQSAPPQLDAIIPGRRLQSLPIAGECGAPFPIQDGPFIERLGEPDLLVAFPSCLTQAQHGVSVVNRLLDQAIKAPAAVRLPGIASPRIRVHGGIIAPGEALPRAIPDNISLRIRLISCAPAFSLLTALLLLHRRPNSHLSLEFCSSERHPTHHVLQVRWRRSPMGELLDFFSAFIQSQGWHFSRAANMSLGTLDLLSIAEARGISMRLGSELILNEKLFVRLQEDPETRLVYEALNPLEDLLTDFLMSQSNTKPHDG